MLCVCVVTRVRCAAHVAMCALRARARVRSDVRVVCHVVRDASGVAVWAGVGQCVDRDSCDVCRRARGCFLVCVVVCFVSCVRSARCVSWPGLRYLTCGHLTEVEICGGHLTSGALGDAPAAGRYKINKATRRSKSAK